ncbi:helix-turn-helix domain-containing protein [Oleiharenicola lentus]|uniref:helix-turn-helix domain-containing protein n=1 Tax=Oleiharenicola lentus TaxID=2508720 RepID=UPI003F66B496
MGQNHILQIEKYQKQIAKLEKQMAKQSRKLLSLPGKFGFKTVGDFVGAVQAAASAAGTSFAKAKSASRKRAKITPEVKAKVKSLVGDGKTGAEIAEAVGISLPSVANIKKELGLVKKRK